MSEILLFTYINIQSSSDIVFNIGLHVTQISKCFVWLRDGECRARAYLSFVHVTFIDDNNSNAIPR